MPANGRRYFSSNAIETTLSSGVTATGTTMVVGSTSGFPSVPFTAIVEQGVGGYEEVVTVTAAVGTSLTVTRGVDGTSGVTHNAGASFRHGVSARDFDQANAHVQFDGGTTPQSNVHGLTGAVVGTSDSQTLSAKTIASSGLAFAGSTGGSTSVAAVTGSASGSLTLPSATDTLVGRATTDELSNKTLASAVVKGTSGAGLTFNGATSGTVLVKAAATAGSNTMTLAAQTGTVGPIASTNPSALGAVSAGSATTVSASDHVHPTTGLLINTPVASTDNTVQPSAATVSPLILRGAASQSANMLRVQNSGSSDTLLVNKDGQIQFFGDDTTGENTGLIAYYYAGATTTGAAIDFRRARGTGTTACSSNDVLARITALGHDGTAFRTAARIDINADDANFSAGNGSRGRITFWTTPAGTNSPSEAMRITRQQRVGIGQTNPSTALDVVGTATLDKAIVGGGSTLNQIKGGTVSVTGALIGANTTSTFDATITGLGTGDVIVMNLPSGGIAAGLVFVGARVNATDTVRIWVRNVTGAGVTLADQTWTYMWFDI